LKPTNEIFWQATELLYDCCLAVTAALVLQQVYLHESKYENWKVIKN